MNQWKPIKTFRGGVSREVDLWMVIHPSPLSMGMGDSFRVVDAFRMDGKWFHYDHGERKELNADYITHWMPIPKPPRAR